MKIGFDYIGVAVVYFCHNGKGSFVLAQRSNYARDEQGKWDIGAGAIDFGETEIQTLKREIKEEYGTQVLQYEFLGFRNVLRKNTHWLVLDYKVLVNAKMVKNAEPHKFEAVKWFTLKTLPKKSSLHSQLPTFLKLYRHRL